MTPDRLDSLQLRLRSFAEARDWMQFHTPKNVAMALVVEASELLEIFQWLTPQESELVMRERGDDVRDELADVLIYLVRIADILDVDLLAAALEKLERNEHRFPPLHKRELDQGHSQPK